MTSLHGKVIAITGGASGIGLATAHLLASRGASVSLADISSDTLAKAVQSISATGASALGTVTNVTDRTQVEHFIDETVKKFGRLDGAANLAGVTGRNIGVTGVEDIEDDDWDFVLGVNLTGTMYCMRAQLRRMEGGGSIVNAASVAGLVGRRLNAAYAASKHGVIGLSRSAAREVGDKDRRMRVNCIAP